MNRSRIWLGRIVLTLGVILLLGTLGVGSFVWSEWVYLRQMGTYPKDLVLNVGWYEPKQAVPGVAKHSEPLPRSDPGGSSRFARMLKLAESKNAAGLLVLKDGKVVEEGHWHGHKSGDWTNSASMLKSVVSILIGIAIGEGKIASLDEPASRWIPAWREDDRRKITVKHLLQMHAGLRPMGEYEEPFSDASYLALGTDSRYVVDHAALEDEPGTRFDYNNVDFQALGVILEAATGQTFATYLSEKLWKPIGAGDAALWLDRDGGTARFFGFLFASDQDWARVGLLLLNSGKVGGKQVIPAAYHAEMLKPSPSSPSYGLGIWLASEDREKDDDEAPFLDPNTYWLDGHSKQRVYIVPSRSIVIVRVGENGRNWKESALPNAAVEADQEPSRALLNAPNRSR